jgi:hypothetical protein
MQQPSILSAHVLTREGHGFGKSMIAASGGDAMLLKAARRVATVRVTVRADQCVHMRALPIAWQIKRSSIRACIYDSIAHADWPACARAMLDIQLTRARRHTIIYSTVLSATCMYM